MSRKVISRQPLSPYKGSVKGTWREGTETEDSDRYVMEGSGNGAFLL